LFWVQTAAATQKEVKVTQTSNSVTENVMASQKVDYVLSKTPIITSISPSTSSVEGM